MRAGEADELNHQQLFNGETGRTFESATGFAFGPQEENAISTS
jgi:hypothetical protein